MTNVGITVNNELVRGWNAVIRTHF